MKANYQRQDAHLRVGNSCCKISELFLASGDKKQIPEGPKSTFCLCLYRFSAFWKNNLKFENKIFVRQRKLCYFKKILLSPSSRTHTHFLFPQRVFHTSKMNFDFPSHEHACLHFCRSEVQAAVLASQSTTLQRLIFVSFS